MRRAVAIIFAFLHIASVFVLGGVIKNATTLQRSENKPYPPDGPVIVEVNLIKDPRIGARIMWIPVTLGNKVYKLIFDTGSSTIWVMTNQITSRKYKDNTKFPVGNKPLCPSILLGFLDDSLIAGVWRKTDVIVAGYERPRYQILGALEMRNDPTGVYSKFGMEGIFGAGAKKLDLSTDDDDDADDGTGDGTDDGTDGGSDEGSNKEIPEPWLSGAPFTVKVDEKGNSTVTFADTAYNSTLTVPLAPDAGLWWVVDSPSVGGALLDTGSEVLVLPSFFVDEYMNQITHWPPNDEGNESGYWLVECDTDIPDMEFKVTGGSIKILGEDFREPYNSKDEAGTCRTRIVELSEEEGDLAAILGMPAFKSNVVTFDGPGNKIGITPRKK